MQRYNDDQISLRKSEMDISQYIETFKTPKKDEWKCPENKEVVDKDYCKSFQRGKGCQYWDEKTGCKLIPK